MQRAMEFQLVDCGDNFKAIILGKYIVIKYFK